MKRRVRLKLDVQDQGGGRISNVDGQGGWGILKTGQFSWTSYVHHPLGGNKLANVWRDNMNKNRLAEFEFIEIKQEVFADVKI